ncbi:MAG TPA: hypothetical protein PKD90_04475, partial [Phnomibacter sp.]|nr:hypothetical protein [Phnomibacter sp.]
GWAAAFSQVQAQCKSFMLSDRGDTLNCIDQKGRKQGPWIIKVPELRGNPGYDEEGEFVNGIKEGIWRKYNQQGDLLAVENYKWGLLNGKSQYYSVLGLEREESWWAIDPSKKYDTIDVPDLYTDGVYHKTIVKNEGYSMRHGYWTWYDPMTGRIQKTEQFIRDSAVNALAMFGVTSKTPKSAGSDTASAKKKIDKPAVVQEWEKKNAGKKKVVVRDGSTGY